MPRGRGYHSVWPNQPIRLRDVDLPLWNFSPPPWGGFSTSRSLVTWFVGQACLLLPIHAQWPLPPSAHGMSAYPPQPSSSPSSCTSTGRVEVGCTHPVPFGDGAWLHSILGVCHSSFGGWMVGASLLPTSIAGAEHVPPRKL